MARKSRTPARSAPLPEDRPAVTAERFARLYRLLQLLAASPQTRERLIRTLRLDVRGFYRDLEFLRDAGILLNLHEGRYHLGEDLDEATARLPFPDPRLTLGEVLQLVKGRTAAHRYLKERLERSLP